MLSWEEYLNKNYLTKEEYWELKSSVYRHILICIESFNYIGEGINKGINIPFLKFTKCYFDVYKQGNNINYFIHINYQFLKMSVPLMDKYLYNFITLPEHRNRQIEEIFN